MAMGPSTRTRTPAPGLACTPQVCPLGARAGWWRRLGGGHPVGVLGWVCLTLWHSPSGSLSSRFSEPSVDQGPGAGIPSALVLISVV